ncbi:phage portal protein [Casimicrobium huifangae]|uniref:phage portal protein n=1 Tax=Casimicrobium huifangae TaxID=2591109 RepID=UPI003783F363
MSYLSSLFGIAPQAGTLTAEQAFAIAASGTASGEPVNQEHALKISTVWACVGLISESIAMLPAVVYQRMSNGGRQRADNHPLFDLVHRQPNQTQTAFEFFEQMTGFVALRGNAFAKILPGARGFADQLEPVNPDKVRVEKLDDGTLRYRIQGDDKVYLDGEILHLRARSKDGILGLDPVTYARESFGLALAGERYGARFYGNSANPGGVLQTDKTLDPKAAAKLKSQWEAAHSGANQHRVAVLEDGVKWQQMSIDPRNAQFLEGREFSAEEVCRWFRVPPHMVGLTSKATTWGSGIEQMSMGFVTYTLMPWLVRWQQAISRDLILAPQTYFVDFIVDALLRGDTLARYNAYEIAKRNNWMSTNEIRQRENMNPIAGGDVYGEPAAIAAPLAVTSEATPKAHYEQLLREAAGRVVRKEIAAMTKAAKRVDFEQAMADFYADHAIYVAQTLHISDDAASAYVAEQIDELTERGIQATADWDPRRIDHLVEVCHE